MYSSNARIHSISKFLLSLAAIVSGTPKPQGEAKPTQASNPQPITRPTAGEVLIAGTTYTIEWKPIAAVPKVSLELQDDTFWGYSFGFGKLCSGWSFNPFCGTIASCVPNTGKYNWAIPHPTSYPRNDPVFWIEMFACDFYDPNIVSTNTYSDNFSFAAEPEMSSSSLAAAASSSSLAAELSRFSESQKTSLSLTESSSIESSDALPGTGVIVTVTVHDGSSSTSETILSNGVTLSVSSQTPSQKYPLTTSSLSLSTTSPLHQSLKVPAHRVLTQESATSGLFSRR